MGLQSTLSTLYSKDVNVKGSAAEFNEAIYDGFSKHGWDFDDVTKTLKTPGGRVVPLVAKINKNEEFCFHGYEADEPTDYPFMYGNFNLAMAKVIANAIDFGCMIIAHEVEGNGTDFYFISPGKAEEVDVVDAILAERDISGFTK